MTPSGKVEWVGRCTNLEFKREVWAGDINMGIVNICTVFQARRLEEITKGTKVVREEV